MAFLLFVMGASSAGFLLFHDFASQSAEASVSSVAVDPQFAAELCDQSRRLVQSGNIKMAIRVAEKSVSLNATNTGCQGHLNDLKSAERVLFR